MNSGNKPIAYFYTKMFEGRMDGRNGWWRYQDAFESSLYAKELKGRSDVQSVVSDCTSEKVRSDSFNPTWSAAMSAAREGAKGWETTAELSEWLPDDKLHKAVVGFEAEAAKYKDSAGRQPRFAYCYTRDLKRVSKLLVAGGLEQEAFAAKTGISKSDSICHATGGTPELAKYSLRRTVGLDANFARVNWPVTEEEMASVMLPTAAAQGGVSKQLAGIVVSFDEKPVKVEAGKPAPKAKQAAAAPATPSASRPPTGKQDCYAMMARGEKCAAAQ